MLLTTPKSFVSYELRPEATIRLIGFPHSGGGPQAFREWNSQLPDHIELLSLNLPGRGGRLDEPMIDEMEPLAAQLANALQGYFDKPYIFFGHSVGAAVAYEVTRILAARHHPLPLHLFVSSYAPPRAQSDLPMLHTLSDRDLMTWIHKLGLLPADVLTHQELLTFALPPIRNDLKLDESYGVHTTFSPIDVPITAMGGALDEVVSSAGLQTWSAYTNCFTHQLFDGGHFYTQTHQSELLSFIAQTIATTLDAQPKSVLVGDTYPIPDKCVHELFRDQAAKTPDRIAVVAGDQQLTFRELDRQTDLLAAYLQAQGVTVETTTGIYMDTSLAYLIGCLAIWKAGGASMIVSLAYPPALLERVLADADPVFILSNNSYHERLPDAWQARAFNLDEQWQTAVTAQTPANLPSPAVPTLDSRYHCVLTSGTTGAPKGIIDPHRAQVNSLLWHLTNYPYQSDERMATNILFMWGNLQAMLNGIPAYVIPNEVLYDPYRLLDFLEANQITRISITASLMDQILNIHDIDIVEKLRSVRVIILTTEMVTTALRNRALDRLPAITFLNEYGLSEYYLSSIYDMADIDTTLCPKFTPVGRPVFNNSTYVLDKSGDPVPQGVTGEIYIAGDSLAFGYLNLPEKTAERFLPDTIREDGSIMLRTGDVGRILPDGLVEIQGRIDFIVKIRGYRIAPRSIEGTIVQHPAVTISAVTTLNDENNQPQQLVAYVVGEAVHDESVLADIRAYLKTELPHYAVPSYIIPLAQLPLAATGKIDRKQLPDPAEVVTRMHSALIKEEPASEMEKAVAEHWQAVLRIDAIDVNSNFFDLGGHSLLAAQLCAQLRQSLGMQLLVADLFESPTVRSLAALLDGREAGGISAENTPKKRRQQSFATDTLPTLAERPTLEQFLNSDLAPVDAVAFGYIFPTLLDVFYGDHNNLSDFIAAHQEPYLEEITESVWGRVAVINLPFSTDALYYDNERMLADLVRGMEMAQKMGARTVALQGLIPSATDYGKTLQDAVADQPTMPTVTTGHATTTAAIGLNFAKLIRQGGRKLEEETAGFVGLGSIGTAALKVILTFLPHPRRLLLCDVASKDAYLTQLKQEVIETFNFKGEIEIVHAQSTMPDEIYESTLIVGATNVGNVLDVSKLRPGTMLLDDSAPHCFSPSLAIERFEQHADILFTEAGMLRSPEPITRTVYHAPEWADKMDLDTHRRLSQIAPQHVWGCAFSSLLTAQFDLPTTIGMLQQEHIAKHYETLSYNKFDGGDLQVDDYLLPDSLIIEFRRRFGSNRED